MALAYVVGATPTAHWVAQFRYGKDLRSVGSGNLGATNAYRNLGLRPAVLVALVDASKGLAPVYFFARLVGADASIWPAAFASAAVLGHCCSFWTGFRGGKGVATFLGALLALHPPAFTVAIACWLVLLASIRIMSVASLLGILGGAITAGFASSASTATRIFPALFFVFALWTHRSNVHRLAGGREARLRFRKDKS